MNTALRRALLGSTLLSLALLAALPLQDSDPTGSQSQEPTSISYRGGKYTVDRGHSSIVFHIRHMGVANVWGRFGKFSGTYVLDPEDPSANRIDLEVDTRTVDTNSPDRDEHIKTEAFLSAQKHRYMTFATTSCKETSPGKFHLKGDMTLRGITSPIEVEAELIGAREVPMFQDYRTGLDARFTFKRSDFGMTELISPTTLSDAIVVYVSLEGKQPL